jgi:2-methylaconitate cis-trans-isomerase PrpF
MPISLRAMQFRGGTSKGVYLLREDLEPYAGDLDAVLSALMGGAPRQIDGLGGNTTTTSKVAIVGPSSEDDIDVDYLFAQVDPESGKVDWVPTCGNILAGIGPFAIERGLMPVAGESTTVRVRLVNTGARVVETIQTPNGHVQYAGDQTIAGVSGRRTADEAHRVGPDPLRRLRSFFDQHHARTKHCVRHPACEVRHRPWHGDGELVVDRGRCEHHLEHGS